METPRRRMPPPKGDLELPEEAEEEMQAIPENQGGEDEGLERMLAEGLRKLYDPILEEQVPEEMLAILRRSRKRR